MRKKLIRFVRKDVIEGIGMLIVLLSFGFQNFSEELKDDQYITPIIRMNDNIINLSSNDIDIMKYLTNPKIYDKDYTIKKIEERHFDQSYWKNIQDELETSKNQKDQLTFLYISFYILGSIMIIFPKLFPKFPIFKDS